MDILYTIKIKDEKNPPVFKKVLGKGVVEKRTITFKGATKKDLKSPMFLKDMYDTAQEILNEWFEVKIQSVSSKKKRTKKK